MGSGSSKTRYKTRYKILLATVPTILASLAAAFFIHKYFDVPGYQAVKIERWHPRQEGGHLLPNLNMNMQGGDRSGQRVRIITNSKGFRNDREFADHVPPDTFRILFMGDSFVDGFRTDQTRTIGNVLNNC